MEKAAFFKKIKPTRARSTKNTVRGTPQSLVGSIFAISAEFAINSSKKGSKRHREVTHREYTVALQEWDYIPLCGSTSAIPSRKSSQKTLLTNRCYFVGNLGPARCRGTSI